MKQFILVVLLLCTPFARTNAAQSVQDSSQNKAVKSLTSPATSKPGLIPKVIAIQIVRAGDHPKEDGSAPGRITAYPDEIIRFTISNPEAFLETKPTDRTRVVMYGNGLELSGICTGWNRDINRAAMNAGDLPLMPVTANIDIVLRRNDTTLNAWEFFYTSGKNLMEHYADIHASIGWEGMSALDNTSPIQTIRVAYYYSWIFWLWLSLFVIIISGFLLLALKTDALKESKDGPYSLSLTLLFFWTLLIVGGFIYTLVLTDAASAMNSSVLLMLGVSIATSGGAATIDMATLKSPGEATRKPHRSFFKDILTDGNIFNIQRIQVFMWNLVLGLDFVIYTILHKDMPVFSETLLFLAGFSSLSYLGGKFPENKKN